MARGVTVEAAARFRGVNSHRLVNDLAEAAGVRAEYECEHETCAGACRH
jgi:ferredoxin